MKVISTETLHFPSLNWGITKGEARELPIDKEAQAIILAHPSIKEVTKQAESSTKIKN